MEQTPPESNNQNNQPQLNNSETQIPVQSNPEEIPNHPQNPPQNPQNNISDNNNLQNPDLTPNGQISNMPQINKDIPQQEIPHQQMPEIHQEIPNIPQMTNINNINNMDIHEAQMAQQQLTEQYMFHYQNQMHTMANNQELPMNGYLLNYPQLALEQNQYQQQQNQPADYQENKNIYDYDTNMNLFGIAFQNGNCPRLAISSLEKRLDNKIEILELIDNELKAVYEQLIGYPCTKLLWGPSKNRSSLLAFSSDCIQIYDYSEEKHSLINPTKLNNMKSKYCGPLTSFDWNTANDSILGTASVDSTCTIWDLNKLSIKTQLIAHDKEVFDIQFGKEENIFISGGVDGSVRLFDLRNLDHSTIIYETKGNSAINKLAWNLQTSNLIAALSLDKNIIYIFDNRMNNNVSLDELNLHKEPVTGCVWAPDNAIQLCSVSEDCNVIISNVNSEPSQSNNVSYNAPCPINNVDWCKSFPEWIGITFKNRVQLLRR